MEPEQLPMEVVEAVLARMANENGALTMHLIAAQERIKRKDAQITSLRNQVLDFESRISRLEKAATPDPVTHPTE